MQAVLQTLVTRHLPRLAATLASHSIDLGLVSLNWFLTLFAGSLRTRCLLRVWDLLFYEGSTVLFKVALALLSTAEAELVAATNSADIFNLLSSLPARAGDADSLLVRVGAVAGEAVDPQTVASLRRRHLASLMSSVSSYCRQEAAAPPSPRRRLARSPSLAAVLGGAGEADTRGKNIRNTEMFVTLREAVVRLGTYFQVRGHCGGDTSLY